MSDPFIAEIRIFAGNFAPRGWAFCNGQELPIAQNTALFSLIGTIYGGDGRTTTALPDLQGRAALHAGTGPGLSPRMVGQRGGVTEVTLSSNQMPAHTHTATGASPIPGDDDDPVGNLLAVSPGASLYGPAANLVPMSSDTLGSVGGGQPHTNIQPYLGINYIIATVGSFPSRS